MPILRTATRTALGAQRIVKDVARLQQIAQVLARHGMGWLVARLEVPGIGLLRRGTTEEQRELPTPDRVVDAIRELGPTFVKLGQILSTRDDLLPPAWTEALAHLQDDVGPMPWEHVITQITTAFGGPPEKFFEWLDPIPLGTASIAQVHRARFPTGEEVVLKVQRPGVQKQMELDLGILHYIAEVAEGQFPELTAVGLPGIVRELQRRVADECDFRTEAAAMAGFSRNFAGNPHIVIPAVFETFVHAQVLTMQFLDGVKIAEAREKGADMRLVGERFLQGAFQMLLEDGFFHGDVHPGNLLVLPGDRVGLLDFGMVGRLTDEMRENLIAIFFAVQRRDYRTVARVWWELARKDGPVDFDAWERDVAELIEREVVGRPFGDMQFGDIFRQLMAGAMRHKVRSPPSYTMFWKALVTTQGVVQTLIPEVDPLEMMTPYVQRMVTRLYSKERLQEELFYWLTSFRFAARRMPVITGQLVNDLHEGRLRFKAVAELTPEDRLAQNRHWNLAALSVLTAGLFVASSLALRADTVRLLGMPAPATVGYLLSLGFLVFLARGLVR